MPTSREAFSVSLQSSAVRAPRQQAVTLDEGAVQCLGPVGAGARDAADDAIVVDQLLQHVPREHPLGAVRDADVGRFTGRVREGEVRARVGEPRRELLGRPDRARRLEHDEVAALEHRRDGAGGGLDVGEIGAVPVGERGRYGDEEGVGGLGHERRAEVPRRHDTPDDDVQVRLDDVDTPRVDGLDGALVDVDADDLEPARGEKGGGRQADVAEPDHADAREASGHRRADAGARRGAKGCRHRAGHRGSGRVGSIIARAPSVENRREAGADSSESVALSRRRAPSLSHFAHSTRRSGPVIAQAPRAASPRGVPHRPSPLRSVTRVAAASSGIDRRAGGASPSPPTR